MVDGTSATRKLGGTDVIHVDLNVNPLRPNSSSSVDVTMTTTSKRPIGQAMQTDKDSSLEVSFPSLVAVTGNESRRRLERDATQRNGDSDTFPDVESSSTNRNNSAAFSQNCPEVDAVHMKDYDNPDENAGSLKGEAHDHFPDKVRLNGMSSNVEKCNTNRILKKGNFSEESQMIASCMLCPFYESSITPLNVSNFTRSFLLRGQSTAMFLQRGDPVTPALNPDPVQ